MDQQPFVATSYSLEAKYYDREFDLIKVKGASIEEIYMESKDDEGIQEQADEVLNKTTIMPYRSSGVIIEGIDGLYLPLGEDVSYTCNI